MSRSAPRLALLAAFAFGCVWPGARPAWELPPPPVAEGPVVPDERLHRTRLSNGLEVMVLEDHRLPLVELGLVVPRGAGFEALEEAGLATFAAELMKRGAGERDALSLARAVDELGARLEVSAEWDATSVVLSGLSEDATTLFELLEDVVLRPRFEPAEAGRARSERLAALERAKDDPSILASWHFTRTLYPSHRYGLPLEGTPETASALDADAARAFHRRSFVAQGAILYAVGDVDPGRVLERAQRVFADSLSGQTPPPASPPPAPAPPARRIVIVDRPDLNQAQIVIGHDGIQRTSPERVPASLMNAVLGGGGFLSRLMARVRADAGLTYGVWSGFSLRRQPGPFRVGTFTRVAETRQVVDLVLAELERIEREPPSAEELATAKSFAAGQFALRLETAGAIAASLVNLEVHGLPRDALDTYRTRVRAVTAEEVARAARELLHPERAAIVLVGPAEALREQVADLGPVEVVAP